MSYQIKIIDRESFAFAVTNNQGDIVEVFETRKLAQDYIKTITKKETKNDK